MTAQRARARARSTRAHHHDERDDVVHRHLLGELEPHAAHQRAHHLADIHAAQRQPPPTKLRGAGCGAGRGEKGARRRSPATCASSRANAEPPGTPGAAGARSKTARPSRGARTCVDMGCAGQPTRQPFGDAGVQGPLWLSSTHQPHTDMGPMKAARKAFSITWGQRGGRGGRPRGVLETAPKAGGGAARARGHSTCACACSRGPNPIPAKGRTLAPSSSPAPHLARAPLRALRLAVRQHLERGAQPRDQQLLGGYPRGNERQALGQEGRRGGMEKGGEWAAVGQCAAVCSSVRGVPLAPVCASRGCIPGGAWPSRARRRTGARGARVQEGRDGLGEHDMRGAAAARWMPDAARRCPSTTPRGHPSPVARAHCMQWHCRQAGVPAACGGHRAPPTW